MSRRAADLTWERSRAGRSDLLMLVKIADLADDEGRNAWPEIRRLMKFCRMSERGAQYTLRRLVETGEIEIEHNDEGREVVLRGGRRFRPKWFMHVRCVCAWDEYQRHEEPAKIADLKPGRTRRKPANFAGSKTDETRTVCRRNPQSLREKPAKTVGAIHRGIDPLVDPLVEQEQGAAPPTPKPRHENPDDNVLVITRLAHEVFDSLEDCQEPLSLPDLIESIKLRCATLKIAYDSAVVTKAMDAAAYQRARVGRAPALAGVRRRGLDVPQDVLARGR